MELKEVEEDKSNISSMQEKVIENSNVQTSSVPLQEMTKGKLKMLMTRMIGLNPEGVKNSVKVDGTYYKYEPILIFYKGVK